MKFLDDILSRTRERVEEEKRKVPPALMRRRAEESPRPSSSFREALSGEELSIIAEVKQASPSKGRIVSSFPYLEIAKEYEEAGAAAISCLTEPFYFKGEDRFLEEIAASVRIPLLRKDFVIDEYMIHQARVLGASAVLLIVRILSDMQLSEYLSLARELGLSALVECHNEAEAERALTAGSDIVGINNRDLDTFKVDIMNTVRIAPMLPQGVVRVCESGIGSSEDIIRIKRSGIDAFLIGESFMRSKDRKGMIAEFRAL